MSTIKFTVGVERGEYIRQEFEANPRFTFEIEEEEVVTWMHITIQNFNSMDALMLVHGGFEAGRNIGELMG